LGPGAFTQGAFADFPPRVFIEGDAASGAMLRALNTTPY
jgi:hypothetical protein